MVYTYVLGVLAGLLFLTTVAFLAMAVRCANRAHDLEIDNRELASAFETVKKNNEGLVALLKTQASQLDASTATLKQASDELLIAKKTPARTVVVGYTDDQIATLAGLIVKQMKVTVH